MELCTDSFLHFLLTMLVLLKIHEKIFIYGVETDSLTNPRKKVYDCESEQLHPYDRTLSMSAEKRLEKALKMQWRIEEPESKVSRLLGFTLLRRPFK